MKAYEVQNEWKIDSIIEIERERPKAGPGEVVVAAVDLTQFTLPVVLATESETEAHEGVLKDLDKSSNGKTKWHLLVA